MCFTYLIFAEIFNFHIYTIFLSMNIAASHIHCSAFFHGPTEEHDTLSSDLLEWKNQILRLIADHHINSTCMSRPVREHTWHNCPMTRYSRITIYCHVQKHRWFTINCSALQACHKSFYKPSTIVPPGGKHLTIWCSCTVRSEWQLLLLLHTALFLKSAL